MILSRSQYNVHKRLICANLKHVMSIMVTIVLLRMRNKEVCHVGHTIYSIQSRWKYDWTPDVERD